VALPRPCAGRLAGQFAGLRGRQIVRFTGLTQQQLEGQAHLLDTQRVAQQDAQLHQLLVNSGIALGLMAGVSIVLGWMVAGRVLRPLHTITTAARHISVTSLHERLALAGPDDELKELGDAFDDLTARLERSFDAQRRFVANASHELRTPLARQRTVAQVALGDPEATVDSLRVAHERVLAAGAQQEHLIEALLTLARGQAGLVKHEPFDLAGDVGVWFGDLESGTSEGQRRVLALGAPTWLSHAPGPEIPEHRPQAMDNASS
jgi:signal transduction histidine kinase